MSVDQSFDQKKIGEGSLTISPFYKKEQVNCLGKHSLAKYVIFLSSEVTGYTFRGFYPVLRITPGSSFQMVNTHS